MKEMKEMKEVKVLFQLSPALFPSFYGVQYSTLDHSILLATLSILNLHDFTLRSLILLYFLRFRCPK